MVAGGVAIIGAGIAYFQLSDKTGGGGGGNGEEPFPDHTPLPGPGGGPLPDPITEPPLLASIGLPVLSLQALAGGQIIAQGGAGVKLPTEDAEEIDIFVDIGVTNTGTEPRYVSDSIELIQILNFQFDKTWVHIDPIAQINDINFDITALSPGSTAGQWIRVDPGVTIPFHRSVLFLDGMAVGPLEHGVWRLQSAFTGQDIDFKIKYKLVEKVTLQHDNGYALKNSVRAWGEGGIPAFTADIPLIPWL